MSASEVVCPRCQSPFQCQASTIATCPCSGIQLSQAQQQYVAKHWQGCLCIKCLAEIKQQSQASVPK